MMQRPTMVDKHIAMRVAIITMDTHLSSATERARYALKKKIPGLELSIHAASSWTVDSKALDSCIHDIETADILVVTMLFMEDHYKPVFDALKARRNNCDAMVCAMSAGEIVGLTRMGGFDMGKPASGLIGLLKRLRGNKEKSQTGGAAQMRMLRRLPKILRFIPGNAQDVRVYFLTLQYWLGGSEENLYHMVMNLVNRYASGERAALKTKEKLVEPLIYPDNGIYHPRLKGRMSESLSDLPKLVSDKNSKGRVGLLLLRSYILAGNTLHYDSVIASLEAQSLQVLPIFAVGLDARPAIDQFFYQNGKNIVDAVVSLTGFSLVGGPAYNDAKAAEEVLASLDVPYIAAQPLEFQTLNEWGSSDRGLLPVENTLMIAIPELDGAIVPMVFGGRAGDADVQCKGCHKGCVFEASINRHDMHTCVERTAMLAARVSKLVALRKSEKANRKVALVMFNFPPNAGRVGTAAHLSVFESVFNTLTSLKAEGYTVDVPNSVDEFRNQILAGNSKEFGTDANVHAQVDANDHIKREPWLKEIESQWGPAPGTFLSNGSSIFILGKQFGNVFVALQPGFGYEGDPMRLLYEKGFAPTHAFSAFYRYIREDFAASAVLHFGTHGALEFMPGKQSGMSGACWPDRLIHDLPNLYIYASNNPSEGAIAKRRAGATLISYLTPPVSQAGLYQGLLEFKEAVEHWRKLAPIDIDTSWDANQIELLDSLQEQAVSLEFSPAQPLWKTLDANKVNAIVLRLSEQILELEYALIPYGLHILGAPVNFEQSIEMLLSYLSVQEGELKNISKAALTELVESGNIEQFAKKQNLSLSEGLRNELEQVLVMYRELQSDSEMQGIFKALDGRYIRPAPGGDVLRNPQVLPTGRNVHGFDPFRIPSKFAMKDGQYQASKLLERYQADGNPLPESIAMVLWGTDNLKTEGGPIAQIFALMGALPRFDSFGRLAGAQLISLEELGRPRIDVMVSISGIFRDLMPLQIRILAEAAYLAASADEPLEQNFIRKHALAYQALNHCDLETASLRVFGNAESAYGANVNMMIDNGLWQDENELAETYTRRKSFAYGRTGTPVLQSELLNNILADVELTYQNLDSIELGVTTIDTYFDTLGGVSRAVRRAKGGKVAPVYIGDQTRGDAVVRSLNEQVSLETRSRMLNPKWYEGMLKHGYEGVRQLESHLTNTVGWSATTGQVEPWVYQHLTQTFILDPEMRERLMSLNPASSAKVASRLLEASERNYWKPEPSVLETLRRVANDFEDRLEGVYEGVPI
ncbi:magnesium chelatase subunit H [Polynucleobacter paneuropaeus]|uniref:magnesium chelatase n=1 Tax=Polynucleobacter paneuropaeus TaxID=2527775 RepID=A0AAE2YLZ2_9BURK|nr:magnesium chelatase subunit H [Polynucleobacter paneuropaeus]MBT8538343.1 magnesium chelatase subunit H [Polynucleobacter paneuropaeus]MBT8588751.1 magnesium chelatase subunit H [Polynucleobacter paneuropaeus]MBT8591877.1 magnesium chelatase subunit H [Polynucleobacter paneuropaeus]MBT8597268.1 magnesium chelatase subunit H [Polynucleobacter paneuropaeus]